VLTTLAVYSSWPTAPILTMSERGPQTDLIQIRNIEGLGPVNADVNTSPYGSIDGESFVGAHAPKRNIVITVGLNPDYVDWSTEALRRIIYRYFMSKQFVRLVFRSDDEMPDVFIEGYAESVSPTIFSKDGEIQISVICPDPYFTAVTPKAVHGNIGGTSNTLIKYNGTVETGYTIAVSQIGPPDFGLVTVRWGGNAPQAASTAMFQVQASVNASNYFAMGSLPGKKAVQNVQLQTGIITNLLNKITEGSAWPTLIPGDNYVGIRAEVIANSAWVINYSERFGGL
jgi:hypothetical protein